MVTISPASPIREQVVGDPLVINCTVSIVSGVKLSSVMISWMGPGITNDARVTIIPATSSGNNMYISSLRFTYLMEGDNGTYTCNVMILETSVTQSVLLQPLNGKNDIYVCIWYHIQNMIYYILLVSLCILVLHILFEDIRINWNRGG